MPEDRKQCPNDRSPILDKFGAETEDQLLEFLASSPNTEGQKATVEKISFLRQLET